MLQKTEWPAPVSPGLAGDLPLVALPERVDFQVYKVDGEINTDDCLGSHSEFKILHKLLLTFQNLIK